MGIMDTFRNKVQRDVTNKAKELNKKYHGTYSKQELLKMAAQSGIKKMMLKGTILATCVIAGVSAFNFVNNKEKQQTPNSENITTDLPIDDENKTKILTEEEKIDNLSSKTEALNYLKEMYIKEYNEVNGTDYSIDDITFYTNNQNYVYDIGDVYVTHGATPAIVENKLKEDGFDYDIVRNVKIYTVYEKETKEALDSISIKATGLEDVVLGDEYINGKKIDFERDNVLKDMCEPVRYGIDLALGLEYGESESDIVLRKGVLKEAVNEYKEYKEKVGKAVDEFYEQEEQNKAQNNEEGIWR